MTEEERSIRADEAKRWLPRACFACVRYPGSAFNVNGYWYHGEWVAAEHNGITVGTAERCNLLEEEQERLQELGIPYLRTAPWSESERAVFDALDDLCEDGNPYVVERDPARKWTEMRDSIRKSWILNHGSVPEHIEREINAIHDREVARCRQH